MLRHTKHAWRRAVFIALVVSACTDSAITPPPTQEGNGERKLRGFGGELVLEPQMNKLLAQVTREVAIALSDEQLRTQVLNDLHKSPYREHKLHLSEFLRGTGGPLLNAMAVAHASLAAAPGVAPGEARADAVLASLDSIVDLEFYMPVQQHFATWRGGSNLIVASALLDDGRVPFGFDLSGKVLQLSAAEPPSTPTLVLVPVETDFSRIPSQTGPQRSDASAMADVGPGIYMTRAVVYSDHEGWPRGNPEFEVHVFQTDIDMNYIDRVCSGEAQDNLNYRWNTEETQNWTGDVAVATEARMLASPNTQFQMWEDDSDACTTTTGKPPKAYAFTRTEVANMASALLRSVATQQGGAIGLIQTLLNTIPVVYTWFDDGDDDVGIFELPGHCWPTAPGPVTFNLVSIQNGHPVEGWATLDFRGVSTDRDPYCPLTVGINGPAQTYGGSSVSWTAQPTNGWGPYTYQWYMDGSPVGTGQTFATQSPYSDFEISVTATDSHGTPASSSISVYVINCPPPEIQC